MAKANRGQTIDAADKMVKELHAGRDVDKCVKDFEEAIK